MGWYTVDYSYAENSYYGSQKGCKFVREQCSEESWGDDFCTYVHYSRADCVVDSILL